MSESKLKEDLDPAYMEPGEYKIIMEFSADRKRFSVDVVSYIPMSNDDPVLAIEEWLYSNILQGKDPASPAQ